MGPPDVESPTPRMLGGDGGSGAGEGASLGLSAEVMKRLGRYGSAKEATARATASIDPEQAKLAGLRLGAIRNCGNWLLFRHFPTLGDTKLAAANFCCVHLVCGFCAIRRGARMMARYLERFRAIRDKHPELRPWLVTFTVKNGPDLAERMDHLERSLTRLHKRRNGKRSRSVLTEIAGAVWSYEVTYSDAHGWHPHVHAIYLAEEAPDMYALRSEWQDITADSFMVDVRAIAPDENAPEDIDPHAKGFAEVFKYALKAAELPADKLLHSYWHLRGRRLVRSFGKFYGVAEPAGDDLGDEMPAADDLPYIDLLFRYSGGRYAFDRSVRSGSASGQRGRGDAAHVSAGGAEVSAGDLHRTGEQPEQRERALHRGVEKLAPESAHHGAEELLRPVRQALRVSPPGGPLP